MVGLQVWRTQVWWTSNNVGQEQTQSAEHPPIGNVVTLFVYWREVRTRG
jgi:hypothetical protein